MNLIAWIESDANVVHSLRRLFKDKKLEIHFLNDVDEIQVELTRYSMIVCDDRKLSKNLDYMEMIKNKFPHIVRVFTTARPESSGIREMINRGKVFRVIFKPWIESDIQSTIIDGVEDFRRRTSRHQVILEIGKLNQQLENLNQELNQKILERTNDLQISREEEKGREKRVRHLLNLSQELGQAPHIDSYLIQLRRQLKSWHGVVAPFLIFSTSKNWIEFVYIETSGYINSYRLKASILSVDGIEEIRKVAAEVMQRPIGPLVVKKDEAFILAVEHSMSGNSLDEFNSFIKENSYALTVPLRKLIRAEEMRSSARSWEKIFNTLDEPVAIVGPHYKVIRSNQRFLDIGEINGKKCHEVFSDSRTPCLECPLDSQDGVPSQVVSKNKVFRVHSFDIGGSVRGGGRSHVNFYQDITDAQELYGKLVQSEKMAALGRLAGNVAHELNNPLTGIRSMSQLLRKDGPEEFKNDFEEIDKATSRCQGIIKHLLDFTIKDESGEWVSVSWKFILDRTLPLVKAATRRHRLKTDDSSGESKFCCEPQLIQQVVFNLINNASQAMGSESGEIHIEVEVCDKMLTMRVSDTGPGVPVDARKSIFEPYFTTKSEGIGTGLGLHLCRTIVERFKGRIFLDEEYNHGASFVIEFPKEVS